MRETRGQCRWENRAATRQELLDQAEAVSPGSLIWTGHIQDAEPSEVILVLEDGLVVGNITVPGSFYQVRYAAGGVHAIYEIDQQAFPGREVLDRLCDTEAKAERRRARAKELSDLLESSGGVTGELGRA